MREEESKRLVKLIEYMQYLELYEKYNKFNKCYFMKLKKIFIEFLKEYYKNRYN